ncbi:MAG: hypothetical protein RL063_484 [Pseudomonadota bacterium]|jgi:uncharacterized protein YidB (DUF937 family)
MGLFDNLAGSMLAKMGGDQAGVAKAALDIFNQLGGLSGVLDKLNAQGLTEQVASWVGQGDNLSISAEQVTALVGQEKIVAMAQKFAISPDELSRKIAENLPKLVDKLTPNGTLPKDGGNLLAALLSMMK